MKKIILLLAFWLFMTNVASAQILEAKVNRTDIPEGETFLLTIELKDGKSSSTPDFEVLKTDFTIYSVSNAYQTRIINGNKEQSQQWNLVLMPNNKGQLVIPSIKLDNMMTKPLKIKVGDVSVTQKGVQSDKNMARFKIEGNVDNRQPLVQQQINYTLTLYDAGGLQGDAPVFLTNNTDDWIIKTLGEPQVSSEEIDGKNYRVIKFKYALFAQKSGNLNVPAVRFNGYYLTREQRIDPFKDLFGDDLFVSGFGMSDVFATRNPVQLNVQPISVEVLPAVRENAKSWWLPAEDVNLYAEFETKNPVFKVGEAISRTIYLRAVGVVDTQLPELNFMSVDGIKQYPEKPLTEMNVNNGQIVSIAKTTNVYIPSKAGKIELPEIRVNWYNVNTKKTETAILPAMMINVEGNGEQTIISDQSLLEPKGTLETEVTDNKKEYNYKEVPYVSNIVTFILGMLLCLILVKLVGVVKDAKVAKGKAREVIKSAQKRDLRLLRDAVLTWAERKWPEDKFLSLQDVDEKVADKEFRCELDKLSEALYAKDTSEWNENLFIRVFNKINKKNKSKRKYDEPLPKLYK